LREVRWVDRDGGVGPLLFLSCRINTTEAVITAITAITAITIVLPSSE